MGSDHVRAPRDHEAPATGAIIEPGNTAELSEIIRACEADRIPIAPLGAARTLSEIRKTPVALGISLTRMANVLAYEPADMTITAEAGITVGAMNRAMEAARQRLPVDPRDPDVTTAGALIAASQSGPLRLSEGTVRDLLIGIRYAGRGGTIVHGGGRVVKNVAGYDLMKILGGSFGTLGIIVEATFKVRPIPEHYLIATGNFDRAEEAFAVAHELNDTLPLAHLEVLSSAAAAACRFSAKFTVAAGFSGSRSEMTSQRDSIMRLMPNAALSEENEAASIYARLRDFDIRAWPIVAQLAVAPGELAAAIASTGAEFIAHAGSGVADVFVSEPPADVQASITNWRQIGRKARGHLRVVHCDPSLRLSIDLFDTPNSGALALMRRTKTAFDPAGIFNPECFVGGI